MKDVEVAKTGEGHPAAWRGDKTTLVLWIAAFTGLTAAAAALLESSPLDFWAWLIFAAVELAVWLAAVVLTGRSGDTPKAAGIPRSPAGPEAPHPS